MSNFDSINYTGHTGLGVNKLTHNITKTGYCTTCKNKKCIKIIYRPKYNYIWTWEERRKQFMME